MRAARLTAAVVVMTLSLLGSTSFAMYARTIGPARCCQTYCPRGHASSGAQADGCCKTHLGVVAAATGAAPSDPHQLGFTVVEVAIHTGATDHASGPVVPPATVTGRASPPGSLLAVHTALLV